MSFFNWIKRVPDTGEALYTGATITASAHHLAQQQQGYNNVLGAAYGSALSQQLANSNALGGAYGSALNQQFATGTSTASSSWDDVRDFRRVTRMQELDHAVFKTPVEDLVALWVAKFGNDWVQKAAVIDDEFFEWAALRLRQLGYLEEHQLWVDDRSAPAGIAASQRVTMVRILDKHK